MTLREITRALEAVAPLAYQESYDNCGLQVGNPQAEVRAALTTLDVTEAVLEEAIMRGCDVIVAHHPLIFGGLTRLTGRTAVERIVEKAIKNDIAIYAIHTSLDNIAEGVNGALAGILGLQDCRILSPKAGTLTRLSTYAPQDAAVAVREALFAAGAGSIGKYSECSFSATGTGTFRPGADAAPAIGRAGGAREAVVEEKIEVILPTHLEGAVQQALFAAHPYETVAYDMVRVANANPEVGAGMVGNLPEATDAGQFLRLLQARLGLKVIRHTAAPSQHIRRVAVCGGSGSFLLRDALAAGADAFVTSDYKYHQFFEAEDRLMIADIGHWESERHTAVLLARILRDKLPNFAVHISETDTNPVSYFH